MPSAERYRKLKASLARRGTTAYRQRVAPSRLVRLGLSRTQAEGHPAPGEESARELFSLPDYKAIIYVGTPADPANLPRVVTFWTDRPTDVRAGKYMQLTRALREERTSPDDFRRKVRRMRPLGGMQPLSDPRAVLALIQTTPRKDIVFEYRGLARSRRARPKRSRSPRRARGGAR